MSTKSEVSLEDFLAQAERDYFDVVNTMFSSLHNLYVGNVINAKEHIEAMENILTFVVTEGGFHLGELSSLSKIAYHKGECNFSKKEILHIILAGENEFLILKKSTMQTLANPFVEFIYENVERKNFLSVLSSCNEFPYLIEAELPEIKDLAAEQSEFFNLFAKTLVLDGDLEKKIALTGARYEKYNFAKIKNYDKIIPHIEQNL